MQKVLQERRAIFPWEVLYPYICLPNYSLIPDVSEIKVRNLFPRETQFDIGLDNFQSIRKTKPKKTQNWNRNRLETEYLPRLTWPVVPPSLKSETTSPMNPNPKTD